MKKPTDYRNALIYKQESIQIVRAALAKAKKTSSKKSKIIKYKRAIGIGPASTFN